MKWNTRLVSHVIMGYMLLAFGWWAVHLWRENDRRFLAETELLTYKYGENGAPASIDSLRQAGLLKELEDSHARRKRMVIGEGLFFSFCLMFGLWKINKSANREMALARQRRNFMLSITHELKSPISSIQLVFETIRKRKLEQEQLEKLCLNGVRDSRRLNGLVEDLLLASRLESNWQPLLEPIDLKKTANEIATSLKLRFPKANIHMDFPADMAPINADPSGFTALLQNLMENALKYSPAGAPVNITASQENGKFELLVADQGLGIPDSEKKSVIEKFYRVGSEETRKTTGTGLGLYIVNQVVKAHGGRLSILDNEPRGTIFKVQI